MFNKASQYVNTIKYNNQLKIDYQVLDNGNIVSNEQSTFLLHGEIMPKDAVFKLKSIQKEIPSTYISTIIDTISQKVVQKEEKIDTSKFDIAKLNEQYNIALDKSILFETKHYFAEVGIDFIFSPFHIINLHTLSNPSQSRLDILILNNKFYCLILDNERIIYQKIIELSKFEDIKESHFYENEIVGQKLFDEIHYLEFQNSINTVLEEFYQRQNNTFIEKITLLYTLRQLSEEQIKLLKDELMIDINYHPISLDESVYELSKSKDNINLSFMKPRDKRTSGTLISWALGAAASTLIIIGLIYYMKEANVQEPIIEQSNIVEKTITKPDLPNHIAQNTKIQRDILSLFDIIPYNVVLQSVQIKQEESTLICEFLEKDTFIKVIQPKLLNLYKTSTIKFLDNSQPLLKGIISNKNIIKQHQSIKNILPKYITDEFVSKKRVKEQLQTIMPKDTIIKFKSSFKSNIMTFNYLINTIVKTPKEFFEIIETLNKELYSINIAYPISFEKTNDNIEVSFNLQFHQNL